MQIQWINLVVIRLNNQNLLLIVDKLTTRHNKNRIPQINMFISKILIQAAGLSQIK